MMVSSGLRQREPITCKTRTQHKKLHKTESRDLDAMNIEAYFDIFITVISVIDFLYLFNIVNNIGYK